MAAAEGHGVDLDHTSFAVHDALVHARRLREQLGATPIFGEVLPEFRYLLLYVGDGVDGARIELLDPKGPGFLARHLARHGEGPHHITFTVPDLRQTVDRLRSLGAQVVGEDYDHDPWREAFVVPDDVHGVVIQVAQTPLAYPPPAELLATRERDLASFPSSAGATERLWWTPVWDAAPATRARLGATHLTSGDLTHTRRLFVDVLGAREDRVDDQMSFSWPSGTIAVTAGNEPGVTGMALDGGPAAGLSIGPARLGGRRNNQKGGAS